MYAADFGLPVFTHDLHRPDLYVDVRRFETMPSSPSSHDASKAASPSISACNEPDAAPERPVRITRRPQHTPDKKECSNGPRLGKIVFARKTRNGEIIRRAPTSAGGEYIHEPAMTLLQIILRARGPSHRKVEPFAPRRSGYSQLQRDEPLSSAAVSAKRVTVFAGIIYLTCQSRGETGCRSSSAALTNGLPF